MFMLLLGLSAIGQVPRGAGAAFFPASPRLFVAGRDDARGTLINCTPRADTGAALDRSRPTLVLVHGANPYHPFLHLEVAPRYAEAIALAGGRGINVLGWDWNAGAMFGPTPSRSAARAVAQGSALAAALLAAGLAPENLHLVGQSTGCIVAASAARQISLATGRCVDHLTLLDPWTGHHTMVFETLHAGASARVVDHYWAAGPSGFGSRASYPAVRDHAFVGPSGWKGFLSPERLDHLQVIRWHIRQTAANPWSP